MKVATFILLSILFIFTTSEAQVSPKEKEFGVSVETKNNAINELYLADRLYEDGSYEEAFKILVGVAKADPVLLNTYENLYKVSVKLKRFNDDVIQHFVVASKIYDNNCEMSFFLAELLSHRREYQKALTAYESAISIQSTNKYKSMYSPYFYSSRGFCYIQLNAYTLAEKDYTQFLDIFPKNTIGLLNRGYCYYKLGNMEKAKTDWQIAATYGSSEAKEFLKKIKP